MILAQSQQQNLFEKEENDLPTKAYFKIMSTSNLQKNKTRPVFSDQDTVQVLALDGGGLRGLFSASVIVIVQHRVIQDPDTGAKFTVKRYRSEISTGDDSWKHQRIILSPESNEERYSVIEFEGAMEDELRVIGEFIAVIG